MSDILDLIDGALADGDPISPDAMRWTANPDPEPEPPANPGPTSRPAPDHSHLWAASGFKVRIGIPGLGEDIVWRELVWRVGRGYRWRHHLRRPAPNPARLQRASARRRRTK